MTVVEADKVMEALQLINWHCKDLTVLQTYLWQQEDPDRRKDKLSTKTINGLNRVAFLHYGGVDLISYTTQADAFMEHYVYNTYFSCGASEVWIERGKKKVREKNSELEKLRKEVSEDRKYLYLLKKIFLNYLLDHDEEGFQVLVTGKTCTYAGKAILVSVNHRGFHLLSDERYDSWKEGNNEDYVQKTYSKINCYRHEQVMDAVHTVLHFLKVHDLSVDVPEKWR